MSEYLQEIAQQHRVTIATVVEAQEQYRREVLARDKVEPSFHDWFNNWIVGHPEAQQPEVMKVTPDSPPGRSLQQALRLLQQQPVGTASNILIEAALQWALVQRENALLRIRVEDLELRLRAAGVEIP